MRRLIARRDIRSEDGVSLVEMLIAVLLTGILLTIVLGVLSTFSSVEQNNQSNYDELDQLIPVGTSFQHLLRSAVSWAPATNGIPTPPFGTYRTHTTTPKHFTVRTHLYATSIAPTHLTFFSNTGKTEPTGKLLGPTKVTAALTCPSITPPTTITKLKVRACTFTVTIHTPTPTSCPGLTSAKTCYWTWTGSHRTNRTLFKVGDVNNWTTAATQAAKFTPVATRIAKAEKPVFSYYKSGQTTPVAFPSTSSPSANPFYSCAAPTATHPTVTTCKADHIQSVKVDVEVATPKALKSGRSVPKVEDQTVTYQLSAISQTYTEAVG